MITLDDDPLGRVYLDHNATSPARPQAVEAVRAALAAGHGNPSSVHREGRAAKAIVESSREEVAALLGVPPGAVVFTSGGSEAIEAAIRGVADRAPVHVRRVVMPSVEHSAVLEAVGALEARGFLAERIPCDADGRVDVDRYLAALKRHTALACLQWANPETGVVQPVEEVGRACRRAGIALLVDAVQAAGKVAMDPRTVPADFLAVSSHKLGGPQGVGALTVREGIALAPLIHGGAQERRRRGGTPAVALIAGFGAAAAAARESLRDEAARLLRLRARLEARLRDRFPEVRLHGQAAPRLPNTVNFSIPEVAGDLLVIALDLAGFAVSTGSACASGAVEPSHVLLAMGCDDAEARGAVRVSFGWNTAAADIDRFADALPSIVARLRREVVR